ncbi:hypothetical protein KCP73_00630 [Salmonella enterica subsp. enterica]|nr:hypothetical protein KCP73_00630 [Salmonella enterica subsp. enterica]
MAKRIKVTSAKLRYICKCEPRNTYVALRRILPVTTRAFTEKALEYGACRPNPAAHRPIAPCRGKYYPV